MAYQAYSQMKGWSRYDFGTCSTQEKRYFAAELARHGALCAGRRILELGFGNGNFLRFARDSGADVVGIEIQEELLKRAVENGFVVHSSLDQAIEASAGHSFDLAVAFDVIEHLPSDEAIQTLRKVRVLINSSTGLLVARFPNGDSPFGLFNQNGDMTHRLALGAGTIAQILARSGWKQNYLGEPAWICATFRERVLMHARNVLRCGLERPLIALYYGRGGPRTLYHNYILAASPAPVERLAVD